MEFGLDCYACFLRQALEAARFTGLAEADQRRVMVRALEILQATPAGTTPPEIAHTINGEIGRLSGNPDPYREVKREWTERALGMVPRLEGLLAAADDPLDRALRLAVAGNIIDLAPGHAFDLEATLERVLEAPFAVDERAAFRVALSGAAWVLWLGDNAGETVFDRVAIPALGVPVTWVAKGGPIINDATLEDARHAGLDGVATLATTGSDLPGTVLERCGEEFAELYKSAPLVLAKGQANYETLSGGGDRRVFYLLQVKCVQIARQLAPEGSLVLAREG